MFMIAISKNDESELIEMSKMKMNLKKIGKKC